MPQKASCVARCTGMEDLNFHMPFNTSCVRLLQQMPVLLKLPKSTRVTVKWNGNTVPNQDRLLTSVGKFWSRKPNTVDVTVIANNSKSAVIGWIRM